MSNAPITVTGRALPDAVTKNIIKGPIVKPVVESSILPNDITNASLGFNQSIYKVKLVANDRTFNMLLPPSIESKHPGRSNPLQLPGLQIESTSAISKLKIPGFFPIYQHLGIESLYISMSGMFTGYDGEDQISTAGNWEGWDNLEVKGGQDAYTAACDLFDFAVKNKALTTVTISTSDGSFDPKKSSSTTFRDERSNIRFKGYIKELKQIYIRQDRVYYMLKFEIIDLGNVSKECNSKTNKNLLRSIPTATIGVGPQDLFESVPSAATGQGVDFTDQIPSAALGSGPQLFDTIPSAATGQGVDLVDFLPLGALGINEIISTEDKKYRTKEDLEAAEAVLNSIGERKPFFIIENDLDKVTSTSLKIKLALFAEQSKYNTKSYLRKLSRDKLNNSIPQTEIKNESDLYSSQQLIKYADLLCAKRLSSCLNYDFVTKPLLEKEITKYKNNNTSNNNLNNLAPSAPESLDNQIKTIAKDSKDSPLYTELLNSGPKTTLGKLVPYIASPIIVLFGDSTPVSYLGNVELFTNGKKQIYGTFKINNGVFYAAPFGQEVPTKLYELKILSDAPVSK